MRDLNFFEPYIDKKDLKLSKQVLLVILLSIVFLGLLIYAFYNQLQISRANSLVEELRLVAEDPKILEKVANIKLQEDDVNQFRLELEGIRDLNNNIEDTDFINENFIKTITSKMPEEVFLTSYKIDSKEINLSGISKYKISVAEFKKGLEAIEKIENIFISHIIREEDHYKFNLTCLIEEVPIDDEEVENEE